MNRSSITYIVTENELVYNCIIPLCIKGVGIIKKLLLCFFLSIIVLAGCSQAQPKDTVKILSFGGVLYSINGQTYKCTEEIVPKIGKEYAHIDTQFSTGPAVYVIPGIAPGQAVAIKNDKGYIKLVKN